MINWKERYKQVYDEHQKREYPASSRDFGTLPPKYPSVETHNGLRRFCKDFLKFCGHHTEVVNTMGRPVPKLAPKFNIFSAKLEQIEIGTEWQKGSGKSGSSDVHAHIKIEGLEFAIPVKIECKVGKDTQRKDQERYEAAVKATGALYWLIRTPEELIEKYDELVADQMKKIKG